MVYTGVIELVGYREWTESIGSDREWVIQVTQSRVYEVIQAYVKDFEGAALPLRYDIQLILLPSEVDPRGFAEGLKSALSKYSPTEINVSLCCGVPPEAIERCWRLAGNGDYFEGRCSEETLAVAHADLNYYTQRTKSSGLYRSYVDVLALVANLAKALEGVATVQYLGGDNLVAVTSEGRVGDVVKEVIRHDNIKVGVGISKYPRRAFEKAAEALTKLREGGRVRKYLILRDTP